MRTIGVLCLLGVAVSVVGVSCVSGLATERLEAELLELAGHLAAGEARWLVLLAEFDRRRAFESWGARDCATWLGWRLGISRHTAAEKLRVAYALEGLPLIGAAFAAGALSFSQVRALTRVAGAHNEEALLACARGLTAAQLDKVVAATVDADRNTFPERACKQLARRGVFSKRDHASGLEVRKFVLLADEAQLVDRMIEHVARRLEAEQGDAVEVSWAQRRADALVAVAETMLGLTELGHLTGCDAFHLVVHADDEVLDESVPAGTDAPRAYLERGPSITAETVRRICCDATVSQVIEVAGKTVVVTDEEASIPLWVRRAVKRRDKTCVFPGCGSVRVDVHHLRWRKRDGGTHELANLAQLCRFHHRLVHEGGYQAQRVNGTVRFYAPGGRELRYGTHATTGHLPGLRGAHGHTIDPSTATTYLEDGYNLDYIVSCTAEPHPERHRPRGDWPPPPQHNTENDNWA